MTENPNNRYPVTAARDLLAYSMEGLRAMDEGADLNIYSVAELLAMGIRAHPKYAESGKHFLMELADVQSGLYCEEEPADKERDE